MNDLGLIIKKNRELHNLTQDELALKLNVTRQAISNWERSNSYPDIFSLKELSKIFCITMDEMVSDNDVLGNIIEEVSSVELNVYRLVVKCPNCSKKHELTESYQDHKMTRSYKFYCDCQDDFIFEVIPSH